jgi:hypothetical protein
MLQEGALASREGFFLRSRAHTARRWKPSKDAGSVGRIMENTRCKEVAMRELPASRGLAAAALVLIAAPAVLAAEPVPALVLQARYVILGYDLGDRFLSESDAIGQPDRVTPEDRKALSEVRDLIEKWDRYVINRRPEGLAELLIAVRAGRRTSAGVRIGRPGDRPTESGAGFELSSGGGDMLSVYESSSGGRGVPLWRGQRQDGFSGPSPTLVEQFKTDVESAARKP